MILLGIGLAIFGGISEVRDSNKMDRLIADNAFTKGPLNSVSTTLGSLAAKSGANVSDSAATIVLAAAGKIDQLQSQVTALQKYKQAHEAQEWPALNAEQQAELVAALSKYSGQLKLIQIIDVDSRGELLVDSLLKMFKAAHLPKPTIGTDGIGMTEGLMIAAKPKEIGEIIKGLFEKLGYQVPPVNDQFGPSQSMLQILIGRRIYEHIGK